MFLFITNYMLYKSIDKSPEQTLKHLRNSLTSLQKPACSDVQTLSI